MHHLLDTSLAAIKGAFYSVLDLFKVWPGKPNEAVRIYARVGDSVRAVPAECAAQAQPAPANAGPNREPALIRVLRAHPGAVSVLTAVELIRAAIASLDLRTRDGTHWRVQDVGAPGTYPYGDGYAIRLIGHHLYINASGAFRICRLTTEIVPVLTKTSANGVAFVAVPGFTMPALGTHQGDH